MHGYDLLGNIAVVKFDRKEKKKEKEKFAKSLIRINKNIKTVLEKTEKFKGRLRVQKTKHIFGEKTKEALYKENGCVLRFNVDSCYFSPRLAAERKELAERVKKGEKVLVLCGGVGPYAVVIAKAGKADKIISVELGRECTKYAVDNIKRNKVQDRAEAIQGDVRKVVPKIKEKFDRIILARPNLSDSFLDIAFTRIKKGGEVNYYGFCDEDEIEAEKFMINSEAKEAGKRIKIFKVKWAGDIGIRKFRYRADFKVLN